jgi:enterochelin esterase family protein
LENSEKKTISDPLNQNIYAPNSPWTESILTLPKAPPQPWRNYKAEGKWQDIEINSRSLGGKSTVNVYLPKSWNQSNAKNWNVFIGMDGIGYREPLVPTDRIVEYLIDKGKIQPTIIVLTEDVSGIGDQSENGYDPVAAFLADEVIPAVREKFGVAAKPSQVIVSGKSRRGMISAYAAFKRSDAIGNVLSLSGSYFWKPPNQTEYELIPRLYAQSEKKPIKFYLSAGIYERFVSTRNAGHYLLATNRHMRDVLTAKGYDLKYEEFPSTHRELNWEDQLVKGLEFLLTK